MFVVVSAIAELLVVVSVVVPVVVCGVSQDAIARAITATNKMLFISSFFKLIKIFPTFISNNYARYISILFSFFMSLF